MKADKCVAEIDLTHVIKPMTVGELHTETVKFCKDRSCSIVDFDLDRYLTYVEACEIYPKENMQQSVLEDLKILSPDSAKKYADLHGLDIGEFDE